MQMWPASPWPTTTTGRTGASEMRIDRISANIRYSKAQEGGAWKTVELAAEASVTPSESWQEAQAQLYAELGQQIKALWSNRNGNGHHAQNGAVASTAPESEPEPTQGTSPLVFRPRPGVQAV